MPYPTGSTQKFFCSKKTGGQNFGHAKIGPITATRCPKKKNRPFIMQII